MCTLHVQYFIRILYDHGNLNLHNYCNSSGIKDNSCLIRGSKHGIDEPLRIQADTHLAFMPSVLFSFKTKNIWRAAFESVGSIRTVVEDCLCYTTRSDPCERGGVHRTAGATLPASWAMSLRLLTKLKI